MNYESCSSVKMTSSVECPRCLGGERSALLLLVAWIRGSYYGIEGSRLVELVVDGCLGFSSHFRFPEEKNKKKTIGNSGETRSWKSFRWEFRVWNSRWRVKSVEKLRILLFFLSFHVNFLAKKSPAGSLDLMFSWTFSRILQPSRSSELDEFSC